MAHFFFGSFEARMDSKNRFVLPQSFRYGLVEMGVLEFCVALGLGGCLALYKKSAMQQIVQRLQKKQYTAKYQQFFTFFFSTLHYTGCDRLGRVLLPQTLKKAVDVRSDLIIAGVLDRVEIWPKERFHSRFKEMTEGKEPYSHWNQMMEETFAEIGFESQEPIP
jgi:MraZ protein